MQVDRLGRGALDSAALAADARLDGADQPRPPAGRGEDREQQKGRRGLAARPGDARDLELLRRVLEEHIGRGRHRRARIAHDHLRDVELEHAFDDERDGTVGNRCGREVVPVDAHPRHGEEQCTRRHRAGVVCEVMDLDRSVPEDIHRVERSDQTLELHRRRA